MGIARMAFSKEKQSVKGLIPFAQTFPRQLTENHLMPTALSTKCQKPFTEGSPGCALILRDATLDEIGNAVGIEE